MEERKWEDMNSDCLGNIFGRLDLEALIFDVPLVCKQWHQAVLVNPLCWQTLVIPSFLEFLHRLKYRLSLGLITRPRLVKFVVGRSQGCATTLILNFDVQKDDLIYVSDVCPALKVLSLSYPEVILKDVGNRISKLIVKWKNLEILKLGRCDSLVQIIDKIGTHCKNFVGLYVAESDIDNEVALAIVSKIETIKLLVLDNNYIQKENLVLILQGCKQLELLHVRSCEGFDEDDEEILHLASHIKDFCCDGSKANFDYLYDFDFDDFRSKLMSYVV